MELTFCCFVPDLDDSASILRFLYRSFLFHLLVRDYGVLVRFYASSNRCSFKLLLSAEFSFHVLPFVYVSIFRSYSSELHFSISSSGIILK